MQQAKQNNFLPLLLAILLFIIGGIPANLYSQTADQLKQKVAEYNANIQALQTEINQYSAQLDAVSTQADTLQNSIKTLDLTAKKLSADLSLTQNKINSATLTIGKLTTNIADKQTKMDREIASASSIMSQINDIESIPLVQTLLSHDTISSFWDEVETLQNLESNLTSDINDIRTTKADLESSKKDYEQKKKDLLSLKGQLAGKAQAIAYNKQQKNDLLLATKDKESNYKKILADRQARMEAFEKELTSYESQLKITIDPNSIPHTGSGVLTWPISPVKITQYFGNTDFATQNPQIYKGVGHNGVDFRASIGTPIKAALDGVISGTGNTDAIYGCYSYGKWVLIKHPNGLSTLYAHLSVISVSVDQQVGTGQIIGYSGNTGATTGPHLHFAVYATQGVRIAKYDSSQFCKAAIVPLASQNAYLNPLSYL